LQARNTGDVSIAEDREGDLLQPSPSTLIDSQEWLDDLIANGRLTPKGQHVARFIATNPRTASLSSASELAGRTGVNVATVVRFAQGLGFSGWREFQLHFRHRYLGSLLTVDLMRDRERGEGLSAIEASLHRDIQNLHGALTSVNAAQAQAAARAIAEARKTLIISSGSYAAVGLVLAHLASFMGYNVTLETRGGAHVVAALASLERGDCVIAISFWRLLKDVVHAARHARDQGIRTVAITDSLFSPLARSADHALIVPTEGIRFFQSVTAGVSVVYGLLAELHDLGGERVAAVIEHAEQLYEELDVLYT
jgi:DNA-binding MurR/RpiR family transcriptional regulator